MSTITIIVRVLSDDTMYEFHGTEDTKIVSINCKLSQIRGTHCQFSFLIGGTQLLYSFTLGTYKEAIEKFKVAFAIEDHHKPKEITKKVQVPLFEAKPNTLLSQVKAELLKTKEELVECTRLLVNARNPEVREDKAWRMFNKMMQEHEQREGQPLTNQKQIAELKNECRQMTNEMMKEHILIAKKADLTRKCQKLERIYYRKFE